MQPLRFPAKFIWGVATAAPQIEGAAFAEGKGASIWDTFSRLPGAVHHGDTLDVACDHYHRFDQDFALMRELGIRHYRLSLAWPRIVPDGDGAVNQAGLDFYHRVFDSLERHGITPWVTMFHWDLPQGFDQCGRFVGRVFAVVDDDDHRAIAQAFDERLQRSAARLLRELQLAQNRSGHILGRDTGK